MISLTQKELQNKITNYFNILFCSDTVEIQDFTPFIIAFTKNQKDHQFKRLETLGDRVLEMIVSELLIQSEKKNSYKDIFHLKSFFVSDKMNEIY
jgi:dsRNA-specific ribonuclease